MADSKKQDGLQAPRVKVGDRRASEKNGTKEQVDGHRERFNSLLRAAVRKPEQED
jgi:hypothetical protein